MDAASGVQGRAFQIVPADASTLWHLQAFLGLAVNVVVFLLIKNGTEFVATSSPDLIVPWVAGIGAMAAGFSWVSAASLPVFGRRFVQAAALFLAFYFLTEPFTMPEIMLPADHPAIWLHQHGRWIGLGLALIGFWRPSFAFAASMVLWMMRDLNGTLTGFYFSTLDIRNVVEVLSFVCSGLVLLSVAWFAAPVRRAMALSPESIELSVIVILAAGIGAHLGNYFLSAMAKLCLDGGPLSWISDNHLYDGIAGAMEKGTMPFAAWPELAQFVYNAVYELNTVLLVFSFLAQALAILAPFRRRWLIAITLVYDLFHLVVYLSFGLLFWKWIALNAVVMTTLLALTDVQWSKAAKWTCAAFVLAGSPIFTTASLAWYDTSAFLSVFFEAQLADGTRMRVPNAYFHTASYQVSQGRLYVPANAEHFNFAIWGSTLHYDDVKASRACAVPHRDKPVAEQFGPLDRLRRYVRANHEAMLKRVDAHGIDHYYLLPHHHMPSPFLPDPFYAIDKRTIRSYVYVLESVCLTMSKGRLERKILARTEIPIPVSGQ